MKILIIDDDKVSRTIASKILSREKGAVIQEAESAEAALELLENGLSPDLIILDLLLPNMEGDDFLQKLRGDSRWNDLPVVVCSSSGSREKVEKTAQLKISGYLIKPIQGTRLQQIYRNLANNCRHCELLEPAETVIRRLGLTRTDYRDLVAMFSEESTRIMEGVHQSMKAGNTQETCRLLELLRSTAASIGAPTVVQSSKRITETLKTTGIDRIAGAIDELAADLRRTNDQINSLFEEKKETPEPVEAATAPA